MYPGEELTRLAAQKAVLLRKIVFRRAQCENAAASVLRPVELLDRMVAAWRRLAPLMRLAALPLSILIQRTFFPRAKIVGFLARWVPLAASVIRGVSSTRAGVTSSATRTHRGADRQPRRRATSRNQRHSS